MENSKIRAERTVQRVHEAHLIDQYPGGSAVKNPPANAGDRETQEPWVLSLSQEHPLQKKMATHSNIPAWEMSWTEEPGQLRSMWLRKI